MKDKLKEQLKMIMDDFDFKEVHEVMTFLRWEWKLTDSRTAVPSIEEIKNVASDCLDKAIDSEEETVTVETGPFEAQKKNGTMLELSFILQRVNPLAAIFNPESKNELDREA